ncbi:MAG: leucine-rich repeat domain-containing protein [Fluviicola sp.]
MIFISAANQLFSQQRFDVNLLNSPYKNGAAIASKLETKEVYEYEMPQHGALVLQNGFRKHNFINADTWHQLKDSVVVKKVQVVFSKYPIRNGEYKEIYPLLFNRIKATINLDPSLNHSEIIWERVWQTHCENNAQVDKLFHGVVIHYEKKNKPNIKQITPVITEIVSPETKNQKSNTDNKGNGTSTETPTTKMSPVLEYMLNHPTTPDALRETAKTLPTNKAEELVLNYYREEGKTMEGGSISDAAVQLNYMYELEVFSRQFSESKDTVVGKVLDRHPEWKKKIVVNDWTGSMYGYGSQVILWHLMNLETSGISTITLFNDGDKKRTKQKKIGKTKGIYTEDASNPSQILALFDKVMRKGGGGDGPENDIEAILTAIKNAPDAEVILIADNSACVRDISLAHRIGRPVRIILCGYNPEEGVNPDYVYLAKITGGGIYTLEDDLEQLNAEVDQEGKLSSFDDGRFHLSSPQCFEDVFYAAEGREFSLENARWNKKDVRVLNGSNEKLTEIPKFVFKMDNLQSLDLSKNYLPEINEKLLQLQKLSELNLNDNQLSSLPEPMTQLRFLEHLFLNNNRFDTLPSGIYQLDFLRELYADNNNLSEVNAFDSKLLTVLSLANNDLTKVPELRNQTTIIELDLSHNMITELPGQIPSSLHHLNLKGNPVHHLPDDLTPYSHLKSLNLQDCPIPVGEQIRIRQALFEVDLTF